MMVVKKEREGDGGAERGLLSTGGKGPRGKEVRKDAHLQLRRGEDWHGSKCMRLGNAASMAPRSLFGVPRWDCCFGAVLPPLTTTIRYVIAVTLQMVSVPRIPVAS
jgi:hypothetical protein